MDLKFGASSAFSFNIQAKWVVINAVYIGWLIDFQLDQLLSSVVMPTISPVFGLLQKTSTDPA